jgi:hypothetical protein
MLNTFIKNQGTTKTIVRNNNRNQISSIDWDAEYDGDTAHISLDANNNNGKREHLDISLDNNDLAKILNMHSVNIPIHKRLEMDFQKSYIDEPYIIELPTNRLKSNRISSPLENEQLIIPLKIDKKTGKYTFTPRKKHMRRKTHVTHRVYKKLKTSRKSQSSRKSHSRKTMSTRNVDLINKM